VSVTGEYRVTDPMAFVVNSANGFAAMQAELRNSILRAGTEIALADLDHGGTLLVRARELVEPRAAQLGLSFDALITNLSSWKYQSS
jgi:hypothetical protein